MPTVFSAFGVTCFFSGFCTMLAHTNWAYSFSWLTNVSQSTFDALCSRTTVPCYLCRNVSLSCLVCCTLTVAKMALSPCCPAPQAPRPCCSRLLCRSVFDVVPNLTPGEQQFLEVVLNPKPRRVLQFLSIRSAPFPAPRHSKRDLRGWGSRSSQRSL